MSQMDKLLTVLRDGEWHTSYNLVEQVYDVSDGPTIARLAARIYDLTKKGYEIERKTIAGIRLYRLVEAPVEAVFGEGTISYTRDEGMAQGRDIGCFGQLRI